MSAPTRPRGGATRPDGSEDREVQEPKSQASEKTKKGVRLRCNDRGHSTLSNLAKKVRKGWSTALGGAVADPTRVRKRLGVAVAVVAVLTGALAYSAQNYSEVEQARTEAIVAAKDAVVPLLSYNYRTIDRQVSSTQGLLTGKFKDDYAALVRSQIIGTSKAQAVSIQTEVVSASIESGSASQVVVFMFVNQQSEVAGAAQPALTGSRLRLTMQHVGGRWLVSDLQPV